MKAVQVQTPGEAESLLEKVDDAFDKLKKLKLSTLIFYFSGHCEQDKKTVKLQLGSKDDCMSLEKLQKELREFQSDVIILLDCCHATTVDLLNSDSQDYKFFQYNACCSNETVPIDPNQLSIFTSFLVQAFTREATGSKCINSTSNNKTCGPECKIDGDIITHHSLVTYVDNHVRQHSASITPNHTAGNVTFHNDYLAYNYSFLVEIKFNIARETEHTTPEYDMTPEYDTKQIKPDEYSDMAKLQKILLGSVFGMFRIFNCDLI